MEVFKYCIFMVVYFVVPYHYAYSERYCQFLSRLSTSNLLQAIVLHSHWQRFNAFIHMTLTSLRGEFVALRTHGLLAQFFGRWESLQRQNGQEFEVACFCSCKFRRTEFMHIMIVLHSKFLAVRRQPEMRCVV